MDLWQMDVRRFGDAVPLARPTRSGECARPTRPTTTSTTRSRSARPAGRCASRPAYEWHREHDAAFGEKSGWERVNWYESNAERGRRVAAAARLGGQALVARHRRRARGLPRGASRSSTSRSFAKLEVAGPGRRRAARAPVRQPRSRAMSGADHLHPDAQLARRHRVRLHRRPPRRGALLDRHRHGVRQPRPRMDPPPSARRRLGPGARHDVRPGPASGSGARERATCWPRSRRSRSRTRTSPT